MLANVLKSLFKAGQTPRVLNVGGGSKSVAIPAHFAQWQHVLLDINPTGGVDIALDARRLHELPPAAFDAVYCSHNLEHYYAHEVPRVLAGFAHILKNEGFVEVRVPDLGALMAASVTRGLDIEDVLYVSPAGPISVRDVLYGFSTEIRRGNEHYAHKTGFTARSLAGLLAAAGFGHVYPLAELGVFELHVAAFRRRPDETLRSLLRLQGV
ncbi:MAG TPA: methyltransferase domain-containing protein [Burkholderiales bacterium]|nr:methyltransferase domain-containing protein [Burkholderiales bacterium]